MKVQIQTRKGFTLVELLVVISIIAVLAGVSMPVFNKVTQQGKMTASMAQAHGIYIGLKSFAGDNDGSFPEADQNANEGYRKLVPRYVEKEDAFFVAGCGWHKSAGGKPDNDYGTRPDYAKCLQKGENHWAYVTGLNDSSQSDLPLVADGFTEGSVGEYTDKKEQPGGIWAAEKAIIVYCDGQKKQEPVDIKTYKVMKKRGDTEVDIFSQEYGTDQANVKNPE